MATTYKKRREDLFPKECLEAESSAKCEPEGDRAVFIISDEALGRLISGNQGGGGGQSALKTSQTFENQEKDWRNKEQCIDRMHAEKIGIDEISLLSLEKTLQNLQSKCKRTLDAENKPLLECYKTNMITPLKCRCLVQEYMKKITEYRNQVFFGR